MTRRSTLFALGAWLVAIAVGAIPASADQPATACALNQGAKKACCVTEVTVTLTSTTVAEAKTCCAEAKACCVEVKAAEAKTCDASCCKDQDACKACCADNCAACCDAAKKATEAKACCAEVKAAEAKTCTSCCDAKNAA